MNKKLTKREDIARKWRSFRKHSCLLLQPLAFAILVSGIWLCFLFKKEIHFAKEDEGPLLAGIFLLVSVAYGIMFATTFQTVYTKYQEVVKSVLLRDKRTFLLYRDERVPIVLHLLILAFSIPLLILVCLMEYHRVGAGYFAVFTASFILSLSSVVITELQNPAKSLWFAERIPAEWLTTDIDTYFKLGEELAPE